MNSNQENEYSSNRATRRSKRKDKKLLKKKRSFFKKLMSFFGYCLLIGVTTASIGLLGATLLANKELEDLPPVDAQYLKTYPASEITDKDGRVIWKPTNSRVDIISYKEIPDLYKEFLVSTEDNEFWDSKGVSPKGLANMVVGTVREKVDSSYKARGGSTIDQQLIKNKYFNRGYGHDVVKRKIQEIFLSLQLNKNFDKEEIMTFYVNDLEFAENAKGIKTIMKTYFNKSPKDYKKRTPENIAELAYLAGLSQAPSAYNLYLSPEAGQQRMMTVLKLAKENKVITQNEYEVAILQNLTKNLQKRNWEGKKQHKKNLKYKSYTDGAKKELKDLGYDIDNLSIQVKTHLDIPLYKKIENKVRENKYYLDNKQQVAVSILDSNNKVVGMVGSRNNDDEFNRATQSTRSTGSSTKPFLAYAPLLQYFGNRYTTASKFDTSNYRYPGSLSVMHNYGQATHGYQTMTASLANSYNTPVARIMDQILGSNRVKTFLSKVDLDVQDTFTSVDGLGIRASTLQVASAYNALNNLGKYAPPSFIDEVKFVNGKTKDVDPKFRQAMNPSVAWVTNHMMRSVPTKYGTGLLAKIDGFSGYGGKTGSVGFDKSVHAPAPYGIGSSDLWYNSITNGGYSVSIWTGYDKPNVSPQLPSQYNSHLLLGKDLQQMLNKKAPKVWKMPKGVRNISGSGLQAHYGVTDSSENPYSQSSWEDLKDYDKLKIDDVVGDNKVDKDWKAKEESPWFEYYEKGGSHDPVTVNEEVYSKMKGSE